MTLRITQPSKEQVRAYMAARESARRPPPPPDEIRRQLGWRLERADPGFRLHEFYLIPTTCSHLAACLTLDWMSSLARHARQTLLLR